MKSITNKLSNFMIYFINFVVICMIVEMLFVTLLIHLPTYRLFEGEFFASGACNEFLSFVVLILLIFMFRSREISEKQIQRMIQKYIAQKFKNSLASKKLMKGKGGGKEEQEDLLEHQDDQYATQNGDSRGKRAANVKRQDSLMSNNSMASKYSGKFANSGPKIGFSAFQPAQVKEKEEK